MKDDLHQQLLAGSARTVTIKSGQENHLVATVLMRWPGRAADIWGSIDDMA
ncbi:MAG: hypothetical protein U1E41_08995 [Paracoccus sp. (in: a-proteobacteria)]|jgi:hypothetical protein